jgi:hypothetical protein
MILLKPTPHCDEFEKLIKEIKFQETNEKLDPWTEELIKLYLPNIKWELGNIKLKESESDTDPSIIIRIIGINGIQYLDSFPNTQQFMWVSDTDHHDSIHPDVAMLTLLQHNGEIDGRVIVDDDGRSTLEIGNIIMVDARKRKPI